MTKPQTTKTKYSRRMVREVFIDEVTTDYTMIKVTGPEHEICADKIVRRYHNENN